LRRHFWKFLIGWALTALVIVYVAFVVALSSPINKVGVLQVILVFAPFVGAWTAFFPDDGDGTGYDA